MTTILVVEDEGIIAADIQLTLERDGYDVPTVAVSGEDVEFTKMGYQLLGGAEWRASRWFGVAGEAAVGDLLRAGNRGEEKKSGGSEHVTLVVRLSS